MRDGKTFPDTRRKLVVGRHGGYGPRNDGGAGDVTVK